MIMMAWAVFIQLTITTIIVLNFGGFSTAHQNPPILDLPQGKLEGVQEASRNGSAYFSFRGIPYVDKPDRFDPPSFDRPLQKWEGIRKAIQYGSSCHQYDPIWNRIIGEEDCLFLNVFTPNVTGKFPVMVYFHGGGYQWAGAIFFGPKYFLDHPVVLVTLNYRLGAMGFLSTGDDIVSGNMGMKDQVAALKWVNQNIHHFGGRSDLVTIFGQSAGAAAVSLHMLSPMSQGLFKHAISQSGSSLVPWGFLKNQKSQANQLGQRLGCPTNSSSVLVQCLKTKSKEDILRNSFFQKWYIDPIISFGPVVEKFGPKNSNPPSPSSSSSKQPFLAEAPYDILQGKKFNAKIPWMVGVLEDEGIFLHAGSILQNPALTSDLNNETAWNFLAPYSLLYCENETVSRSELDVIGGKIKKFYFQNQPISEETRQQLTDLYSDRFFVHGVRKNVLMFADTNNSSGAGVYPYFFGFKGTFSLTHVRGVTKYLGVTHMDDLQYLFDGSGSPALETEAEIRMSQNLVTLWVQFATNGYPKPHWGSLREWKSVSREEAEGKKCLNWFRIDEDTGNLEDPFCKRSEFWDQLMGQHEAVMFPRTLK